MPQLTFLAPSGKIFLCLSSAALVSSLIDATRFPLAGGAGWVLAVASPSGPVCIDLFPLPLPESPPEVIHCLLHLLESVDPVFEVDSGQWIVVDSLLLISGCASERV